MTAAIDRVPRVWAGCLACYNEGRLTGEWVDAIDADEFVPCDRPDHEEWWVMDFENFHGILTGECSPGDAATIARLIDDLDDPDAFGVWWQDVGSSGIPDVEDLNTFRDVYIGRYDTLRDYAMQAFDDYGLDVVPPTHSWQQPVRIPNDHPLIVHFDWASWVSELDSELGSGRAAAGGIHLWHYS